MGAGDLADVIRQWRTGVVSDLLWEGDPDPPVVHHGGASGGFFVKADGFVRGGFLKPTDPFPDHTPWPAVEKICSDLGIELDLPVAPSLLYRRTDAPKGEEQRTCISLVMHDQFSDWPPNGKPELAAEVDLYSVLGAASGIVAFDTYLENVDRSDHRPNMVFYRPSDEAEGIYPVSIDFANCLNRKDRWMKRGWTTVSLANMPSLLREAVQTDVLFEAVDSIERLPDQAIDEIVGRIPSDYLTDDRKEVIGQALKDRRSLIRPVLEREFGRQGDE